MTNGAPERKESQQMIRKDGLTKLLALAGTLLVWFPILTPFLLSLTVLVRARMLRLDWLMPAELFPAALLGGGMLLYAAARARSRLRAIGWRLGLAIGLLVGSQVLADVSGLASGRTSPASLWGVLVVACLAGYALAVVAMGVGGIRLLRDLFTSHPPSSVRQ
jgi:hypothetical protein